MNGTDCGHAFRGGDAAKSEMVRTWRLLHGDPVVRGQLSNEPVTVEAANAAVLLSAEHVVRIVVGGDVIDVCHACIDTLREAYAARFVGCEYGAGEAEFGFVGDIDEHVRRQNLSLRFSAEYLTRICGAGCG